MQLEKRPLYDAPSDELPGISPMQQQYSTFLQQQHSTFLQQQQQQQQQEQSAIPPPKVPATSGMSWAAVAKSNTWLDSSVTYRVNDPSSSSSSSLFDFDPKFGHRHQQQQHYNGTRGDEEELFYDERSDVHGEDYEEGPIAEARKRRKKKEIFFEIFLY